MESIKIGIISDTHGNLPALKVMLDHFDKVGCNEVIHVGDAIAIGPFSKECLDLLIEKNVTMTKGNHELLYLVGIDKTHVFKLQLGKSNPFYAHILCKFKHFVHLRFCVNSRIQ